MSILKTDTILHSLPCVLPAHIQEQVDTLRDIRSDDFASGKTSLAFMPESGALVMITIVDDSDLVRPDRTRQ